MDHKNISISTQLKLGFAVVIVLVAVLGVVSFFQADLIHQQTETMYDHPLTVRRAIGSITVDVFEMQTQMRVLPRANSEKDVDAILRQIDLYEADANTQVGVLYDRYLGPQTDLDSISAALISYKNIRLQIIGLFRGGKTAEAEALLGPAGIGFSSVSKILGYIAVVDKFGRSKADALYASSRRLRDSLQRQLILLICIIVLLSIFISFIVLRNIRIPLFELTRAAREFEKGNFAVRSIYAVRNEFGVLSETFNELAETVQMNLELNEKATHLAGLMLSEDDAKKFFHATLSALATHTGSNVAAVYLLDEAKKNFVYFESIGLGEAARQSFSAENLEGEFGPVLLTRKLHHLKNIPDDTRFLFHTVNGTFVPREIITIPILAGKEVVAIVSLSSISIYTAQALLLIDNIVDTLGARVDGILAYRKTKEFSERLKNQNLELQAQQSELAAQSSELMEQNRELEAQKQQLDEAGRLKTTFLSNMSHELRTPLNSVIALAGVLHRRLIGKLPAEEYSYIEVIERNGKMLLMLINDILDISRIESGREEIEITRFPADLVIADVVGMIEPQAIQKNISLRMVRGGDQVMLESDSDKCRHILQNLVGNAVKFTEKGSVEVAVIQKGEYVEIAVTDSGIGIAQEHIGHIFDEFRQADGSTSRRFGGTGLGLAIAKKYAILLGGKIVVASVPGQGSVFTLSLPLRVTNRTPIEAPAVLRSAVRTSIPAAARAGSVKSGATILLVEDSEPAIIQLRDILHVRGYKILVAHDGGEALAIIDKTIPDAIILDLMMPGIDGFSVLKTVRNAERTAHVPVLILTAKHVTKEELKFLTRNNIHQLIQKGDVNRDELLAAVDTMVDQQPEVAAKPDLQLLPPRVPQIIKGRPAVLVVEDNPDNMITIKALLADDYTVFEAHDGHAAVEVARLHKPHLVLMDIALPNMDGFESFRTLRTSAHSAHIPVIAVTASAMTSDREAILAHGFDGYVAKPIDAALFFKTIEKVLYGK